MRSADYIEMTTTSIAGTSGDGAVTCTQITSTPTFTIAFGSQNTSVRYVIEDTVNKKFEQGLGQVSSNVLTRTRPQVTWDGTTWDDSTPSALQFGASPTSGNIKIRLAPTIEAFLGAFPGVNSTIAGDTNWRDYPMHGGGLTTNSGSGNTLTADREYYSVYFLPVAGLLAGFQFEVTTAVASSNLKAALYSIGYNGLPEAKIVDFTTTATTTTGVKTDTATGSWSPAGPVWLPSGWYAVGHISGHAIALRGYTSASGASIRTPYGRQSSYGWGGTVYVAGSYTTGLPASPSLGSGTMVSASSVGSFPWLGLKVTP